ncbi:MAG: hypothetical protein DRN28_00215 [Thermoplasmata archaeon]|nr:MAG: hypothetical protein DRN28_00215 [Thermoplasmata archaeon]
MKREKIYVLAAILAAFLFIPWSPQYLAVDMGEKDEGSSQHSDSFVGTVISTDDRVKIEPVPLEEVPSGIMEVISARKALGMFPGYENEQFFPQAPLQKQLKLTEGAESFAKTLTDLESTVETGSMPLSEFETHGLSPLTLAGVPSSRATLNEQEPNDSPANGTYISSKTEKTDVSGSFGSATPQGQDDIDIYKIALDSDSSPGGLLTNLTLHLKSWSSEGVQELIERNPDDWEGPADVNFDYIDIFVLHDYFLTFDIYGETWWYYDDFDDTNNPENLSSPYREGWNLSVEAPHQSFGQLSEWDDDPYLEFRWYYIVLWTISIRANNPSTTIPRQSYVLEVDPTVKVNGDLQAQDFYNSTALPQNSGLLHLNNFYDHWDCFNITGNNPEAIWDVNITLDTINYFRPRTSTSLYTTLVIAYAYFVNYEENLMWYTYRYSTGSNLLSTWYPSPVNLHMVHNYTASNRTALFVGFYALPVFIYLDSSQNRWVIVNSGIAEIPVNYTVSYTINEIPPNNKPVIAGADVKAIDPEMERRWGNLQDTFRVNVTYVDADNDPPSVLQVIFDYDDTPKVFDILADGQALYKTDNDYTDGKEYYIDILGSELGVEPLQDSTFHYFKVIAKDDVTNPILDPEWADEYICPHQVEIWDDQPPRVLPAAPTQIGPYDEDSTPPDFLLSNVFTDPDGFDTLDMFIWNETIGNWSKVEQNDVFRAEITMGAGQMVLRITPLPNMYGTREITLMAKDKHYNVTKTMTVQITPVNDPPVVEELLIFETSPDNPIDTIQVRDNEAYMEATEDQEMKFKISASDIEGDELEFYLDVRRTTIPDVDVTEDGIVTFTPTNDDVGEQTVVVSVDDGGAGGKVDVVITVDVQNVNDPPSFVGEPMGLDNPYTQGDEISITLKATDPDVNDRTRLTFSTDFQDVVDSLIGPGVLQKGVEWDLNSQTGVFTLETEKQEIFGTNDRVEIKVNFTVTDPSGASDTKEVTFILLNRNDPPESPTDFQVIIVDADEETPGLQNLTVKFIAPEVSDPDGDTVQYIWDFGDGMKQTTTELEIVHRYLDPGTYDAKTYYVTLMVYDGDLYGESTVRKPVQVQKPQEEKEKPPPSPDGEEGGIPTALLLGVVVVVLAVVLLVVVMLMRKKKPPVAPTGPAQPTLPGGAPPQLPPAGAPGAAPQAAQPPTQAPAPQQPPQAPAPQQAVGGLTCPHCGAPIEEGWVICPNCKNPLL